MYIGDYLARRCVYSADQVALVDAAATPSRRYTYAAMNDRADRTAGWLRAEGVGKGSRVAVLASDGVAFYDLFFACGKLGAVLVPLNWRLHPLEVEAQVRLVEPAVLLHDGPLVAATVAHLAGLRDAPRIETLGSGGAYAAGLAAGARPEPITCESLTERDAACLLFTGGTTGRPKAAEVSHGQIVWNTLNTRLGDVRESDVFLNIFPLFHAGGLFAFSVPLLILGGRVVQLPRFTPADVLRQIGEERVTIFGGVPTVFQMLADAPEWAAADLSSLRFCMSGGAPMPVPLIRRYQQEKGVVFRQGFGMTEFGPGVFSLAATDAERKAGSIGKPNFFVDARVVDPETNRPLPPGEVGELVLRGPSAMSGYFRDPEATARVFDAEGYLHTGDLARVDDEGYFSIVDRLKDMYISGGENVYPAEVEGVLYRHPAVAMCAVVGVPDERWGEVGRAFVVLRVGASATEAELIDHARSHLARYKLPRSVVFLDRLPVSGAGKILKRELRTHEL
ncbi:MAG TPA: long-chain fatty acid--CoA ligase [Longimicrobiales bacterium]|nr:long-chain fatty acid--CoA ligase [Longimicrobiales bacterium]